MKKILLILASFFILGLSACGGGGSADPIDKYLGTWEGCVSNRLSSGSSWQTQEVTKRDATTAWSTVESVDYSGAGCTGTASPQGKHPYMYALTGTKMIDTNTVDKVIIEHIGFEIMAPPRPNDVFVIIDSKLRFGNWSGSFDAERYPNTLSTDFLTRK